MSTIDTIRRANDRGRYKIDWLDSRHSFSFGHYYDPDHMGYGLLRVINDDRVAPGGGFATPGHRDMEIISYVVEGALEHRDSLGNGSVIRPGDVQRMSAGSGIRHSEFNGSKQEPVRFLQIWIPPAQANIAPGYEERHFPREERLNTARLLISPDGAHGSLTIHQDARLWGALLTEGAQATVELLAERRAWVQVVRGELEVAGERLGEGDGAGLLDARAITLIGRSAEAEVIVFDLPR
jgi:redox-sensitive bicupin YhaK (pirin superfamily)